MSHMYILTITLSLFSYLFFFRFFFFFLAVCQCALSIKEYNIYIISKLNQNIKASLKLFIKTFTDEINE